jgi:hypothetical protein
MADDTGSISQEQKTLDPGLRRDDDKEKTS